DEFYCEGRGPELHKVHWAFSGHTLRAIDFMNPDESESRHLFFTGVQVVMITPEEVINYETVDQRWIDFRPAGILDLGKSLWLESFSPQHLEKCFHYQIMFYDELFDVICEGIEVREGSYSGD
ncbi:MAG: hypothetical protein AB8I58_13625, partial [Anaerolineales bacterium]